jgi:hypothetical protein
MSNPFAKRPCEVPIWAPGKEPLPLGLTEEDRAAIMQQQQYSKYASMAMESCAVKTVMAGTMGESYMTHLFSCCGLLIVCFEVLALVLFSL